MDSCNSGGFVGSGADTDNLSDNFDLNTQAVTSPWDTYWNSTISRDIPSDLAIMITASGEYEFSQDLDFAVYGDVFQPFALPTLSVEDTFPLPDPPTSVTYRGDRGTFTFFLEYGLKSGIADINQDGYISVREMHNTTAYLIDKNWNPLFPIGTEQRFLPRVSGGSIDHILFTAP
jgi:hypothetical protein